MQPMPEREPAYRAYERAIAGSPQGRLQLTASPLDHDSLVRTFFESWLGMQQERPQMNRDKPK